MIWSQSGSLMRTFHLVRDEDGTGISGVGVIAEGVEFTDGSCVLHWLTDYNTFGYYHGMADLLAVYGHSEKTRIAFLDQPGPETMS